MNNNYEVKLLDMGRRYMLLGAQLSQKMNEEQSRLNLEQVLSIDRLKSEAGIAESKDAIEALQRLTNTYQQAFASFIQAYAEESGQLLEEMPEEIKRELSVSLLAKFDWHIKAQGEFLVHRHRWITAARAVCELVESRFASIVFTNEGIFFNSDNDIAQFNALLETVNDVYRNETALLNARIDRIKQLGSVFGIQFKNA